MIDLSVLIAEDEALVRQGIVALIEDSVGEITECSDGEEALNLLKNRPFDLALLDIGLPRRTGIDILAELRRREMNIKVIILTGDTNSYAPASIYEAGADAFLYKTAEAENFLEIFKAVAKGRPVGSRPADVGSNARSVAELRDQLTPRELQIVKLIVEGSSNRDVAGSLCISEHTVRKHREHINQKLDVHSPASLAAFAIKASLV
ncbi:response regulator [Parasphingorhabdus sp.]|uniref:response regulator n=1 Tax=Parasphingorhabdus sp. TaxID=2709688 RepID=UPI003A95A1E4